jgi:hypothetical protein
MTLKTDRETLDATLRPDGQQREYLILSEEERKKGFVRPVRHTYRHVGIAGPGFPTRDLTEQERERYGDSGYVKFEEYPAAAVQRMVWMSPSATGRFWTQAELDKIGNGCGATTTMARELAETYAREPRFYGATFCAHCGTHLPVGRDGEFIWEGTTERVGT